MNRVFKNKITGDTHKIEINEFNRALDMETLASAHGLDTSQWKFHSASMTVKGTCKTEIKSKGVNIEGLARQRDLNKTANLADAAHSLASASVRENTKLYNELVKRVELLEEMLQVHIGEKYWLVEEQANLRLNYNNEDRGGSRSDSHTGE